MPTIDTIPNPMFADGDTPRARRSDPLSSHVAADRSQESRQLIRDEVLRLVGQHGPVNGNLLNELYMLRSDVPQAHFDTPRKRASDMAREGLLLADRGPEGKSPAVYSLTAVGRFVLGQVSA